MTPILRLGGFMTYTPLQANITGKDSMIDSSRTQNTLHARSTPSAAHPSTTAAETPSQSSMPEPATPEPVILIRHVDFAFRRGKPVLEHIDSNVPVGQSLCILGSNGAGKTTLFALGVVGMTGTDRHRGMRPKFYARRQPIRRLANVANDRAIALDAKAPVLSSTAGRPASPTSRICGSRGSWVSSGTSVCRSRVS